MSDQGDDRLTVREGGGELGARTITGRVDVPKLDRGDAVGRYLVLSVVGEGGMGVVYAAFDPELDRKVAIKLLQAGRGSGGSHGDQAWLLREAQAMARLQHPNALAVHDVGTLPGDRVFVAMELVDGSTLREWGRVVRRSWQDVVGVMGRRGAGAGLAAAHDAGLVHRDFKPDNVLVGNDGRARVMDFGLARLHGEQPSSRDSDRAIPLRSPLAENLTQEGTVAGTPAYMAPEVERGLAADARSDQFAFGVALYEALYRKRPFDGSTKSTPRPLPADSPVPARIGKVALRAIASEPGARYPSMDALLAELVDEPAGSRRTIVAGGLALVAAGATIAVVVATRPATPEPCTAGDRLSGVWDDQAREAAKTSFAATKSPLAADAFASMSTALDRYATSWTDAVTDSCRATRLRGEQSEEVMALRAGCLDARREELKAFTGMLATADVPLVEKAARAAAGLDPIASCANVTALSAPPPAPPGSDAQRAKLASSIAISEASLLAGRVGAALVAANEAVEITTAIHWDDAESFVYQANALNAAGNAKDALASYEKAAFSAVRDHRDQVVVASAIGAAEALESIPNRDGEAQLWVGLADAVSQRIGDHTFDLDRLSIAGALAGTRGDYHTAIAAHEQALAAATKLGDARKIATAESQLGGTLAKSGDYGKAVPHYERALATVEANDGKSHPEVALLLSNLGACYDHLGDKAKAKAALERALAIREAAFGPTSPRLITTLNNHADLLRHMGDVAGATTAIDRAMAIAEKVPGTGHPLYHTVATTRGEILLAAGKIAEARAALDEVLALEGDSSPMLATTLTSRGEVSLATKAWAEAASFDERAITLLEKSGGKDAPDLWRPLAGLAQAKVGLGDAAAAKSLAQRAVAIAHAAQITDEELGPAVALAR